ncbi:hypothetical protein [Emticicia agri]|uniref:O-antigen ligase domain-containing protein n=1 Tax=Emticicia agri TaxID=2492393 RepID=A0A4Q5LVF6_9BACT|nr:hypothetical protein [Emticicia agri]RYU93721.1 hypothetical protein EWM59_20600 [Emticicia agri]
MIRIHKLIYFIPFSIVLVTIYSIIPYPLYNNNLIKYLNNTIFWWIIISLFLILVSFSNKYLTSGTSKQYLLVIKLYIYWNIIEIIRGAFIAETYWDWKGLINNTFALLLPILAYSAINKYILQTFFRVYIKYMLPMFLVFALFITADAYGFYLIPISFLIMFLPILTYQWRIVLLIFLFFVLIADFGARSNIIKFIVPFLLSFIYWIKNLISVRIFEIFRKSLFILPILLFILALDGSFNIFKIDAYIKGSYIQTKKDKNGEIIEDNLLADTRTALYKEVLQSAQKYNSWIIGRSPARGNETEIFATLSEITGRKERLTNEIAIANIFSWTGIIGVLLYFLIFYRASYLAINHSNNIFSKILGIYISFRWLYAWVEDINSFTLNYFLLWLMIGMCFSTSLRNMNNNEMRYWVLGIFYKRFRILKARKRILSN